MKTPRSFVPRSAQGHPFRRSLPLTARALWHSEETRGSDDSDWKLFVLSFAAFFTVFYSFIA